MRGTPVNQLNPAKKRKGNISYVMGREIGAHEATPKQEEEKAAGAHSPPLSLSWTMKKKRNRDTRLRQGRKRSSHCLGPPSSECVT